MQEKVCSTMLWPMWIPFPTRRIPASVGTRSLYLIDEWAFRWVLKTKYTFNPELILQIILDAN
jgi:hypothetical protein